MKLHNEIIIEHLVLIRRHTEIFVENYNSYTQTYQFGQFELIFQHSNLTVHVYECLETTVFGYFSSDSLFFLLNMRTHQKGCVSLMLTLKYNQNMTGKYFYHNLIKKYIRFL